jgi:hypothetical protein
MIIGREFFPVKDGEFDSEGVLISSDMEKELPVPCGVA